MRGLEREVVHIFGRVRRDNGRGDSAFGSVLEFDAEAGVLSVGYKGHGDVLEERNIFSVHNCDLQHSHPPLAYSAGLYSVAKPVMSTSPSTPYRGTIA